MQVVTDKMRAPYLVERVGDTAQLEEADATVHEPWAADLDWEPERYADAGGVRATPEPEAEAEPEAELDL